MGRSRGAVPWSGKERSWLGNGVWVGSNVGVGSMRKMGTVQRAVQVEQTSTFFLSFPAQNFRFGFSHGISVVFEGNSLRSARSGFSGLSSGPWKGGTEVVLSGVVSNMAGSRVRVRYGLVRSGVREGRALGGSADQGEFGFGGRRFVRMG